MEDEDALICDLAETYHIYDYRGVPVKLIATLSSGLGENSRIKKKMAGMAVELETLLLAGISDGIRHLIWMLSDDGRNGINHPESILGKLTNAKEKNEIEAFDTAETFEQERERLLEIARKEGT